ncbi:S-layer homology domain-containing protein [Neobacillus niacini]|uniref:S-layer homology domain-containing protein n=1 Tax=Neobacillus niacini TaxID=86668 RepID=UPI003000C867
MTVAGAVGVEIDLIVVHSVVVKDIDRHWGKDAIEKLASAVVITGYDDGTFKPNKTINREEMVIILSRIVDLSKVDKDASKGNFADIASAMALFDPKGNSKSAEALTIVLNALNLNPQVKTLLDSLK